jgi:hypothetical protein
MMLKKMVEEAQKSSKNIVLRDPPQPKWGREELPETPHCWIIKILLLLPLHLMEILRKGSIIR